MIINSINQKQMIKVAASEDTQRCVAVLAQAFRNVRLGAGYSLIDNSIWKPVPTLLKPLAVALFI